MYHNIVPSRDTRKARNPKWRLRLHTGDPVLDDLLGGGIAPGTTTLFHSATRPLARWLPRLAALAQLPGPDGGLNAGRVIYADAAGGYDPYGVSSFALEHRLNPARALGNISARAVVSWDDAAPFAREIVRGTPSIVVACVAALPAMLAQQQLGAFQRFDGETAATLANIIAVRWPARQLGIPGSELLGQFAGVVVQLEDRGKVATYHLQQHPWLRLRFVRRFASSTTQTALSKARTLDHFFRKSA